MSMFLSPGMGRLEGKEEEEEQKKEEQEEEKE